MLFQVLGRDHQNGLFARVVVHGMLAAGLHELGTSWRAQPLAAVFGNGSLLVASLDGTIARQVLAQTLGFSRRHFRPCAAASHHQHHR
ncbi:hypothetical protein SDC9_132768 [bioreactor metagenome]|uniref:Uncharacterized protein n=1 Tax=bioreactor metagenome TaxID=1076179 RepID=A0A645D909_9ZZZZ